MARRSSARLRNRNSSTPKRVSLSHDAPAIRTPRTAPVKLGALQEGDEMPGAFPRSASPPSMLARSETTQAPTTIPVKFNDTTPKNLTPIKPSEEEMHPQQHQQSTAKPLEEAPWLGFANMGSRTKPSKFPSKIAALQGTPTRGPKASNADASPKIAFTFRREQSLELSPEAKKLMSEKREEAAKIREQMTITSQGLEDNAKAAERKFATPKGKKGRFSAVHMEQFKKMDSIASYASASRPDQTKANSSTASAQTPGITAKSQSASDSLAKSLKRKPSTAQLDDPDREQMSAIPRSTTKSSVPQSPSLLPRSTSSKILPARDHYESASPNKRAKRSEADGVAKSELSKVQDKTQQFSALQDNRIAQSQVRAVDLSSISSPTQASLARATNDKSVNLSKIPAPTVTYSPPKVAVRVPESDVPQPTTPLLARSPSKVRLFANPDIDKPKAMMSPLFKRSPPKTSPPKSATASAEEEHSKPIKAPLLARSPMKLSESKKTDSELDSDNTKSTIPLLALSPTKVTLPEDKPEQRSAQSANSSSKSGLMGRFNLLRSSPMKSILRSPQRLYSDDPAKVAAGTHLATPPKQVSGPNKRLHEASAATAPVQKHVDFSSSTKARYERAQSELSSTPSKEPSPSPRSDAVFKPSPKTNSANYPTLPTAEPMKTPQKRRQTAAPGGFTFRAGQHSIVFGQSPKSPSSGGGSGRTSTIRHVSAEPQLPTAPALAPAPGSKKRKYDFENDKAVDDEISGGVSDKENGDEDEAERPAKRVKPSAPESAKVKPATRLPTLGVKPKKTGKEAKDKKQSTISMARLNALAQPKRRV